MTFDLLDHLNRIQQKRKDEALRVKQKKEKRMKFLSIAKQGLLPSVSLIFSEQIGNTVKSIWSRGTFALNGLLWARMSINGGWNEDWLLSLNPVTFPGTKWDRVRESVRDSMNPDRSRGEYVIKYQDHWFLFRRVTRMSVFDTKSQWLEAYSLCRDEAVWSSLWKDFTTFYRKRNISQVCIDTKNGWDSINIQEDSLDDLPIHSEVYTKLKSHVNDMRKRWDEGPDNPKDLYARSLLFHGIPGTGKTSIALALSKELSVYAYIFPNDENCALGVLVNHMGHCRVCVFDEIDEWDLFTKKKEHRISISVGEDSRKKGLTLDNGLALLTGPTKISGALNVLITNHLDLIPEKVYRKGRVKEIIEIPPVDHLGIKRWFERRFNTTVSDSTIFVERPMNEIYDIVDDVDNEEQTLLDRLTRKN